MNTPPEPLDRQSLPAADGVRRVAFFLLCFAASLACALFLSQTFLLPRIAQVDVGGKRMSIADLDGSYRRLLSDVSDQEKARDASIVPLQEPAFDALKEERFAQPSLGALRDEITHEATALVATPDAIHLSDVNLDASQMSLVLTGDVRHVGPQCQTILADFVSLLRKLPFVAHVDDPAYQRLTDAAGAPHSPFEISLSLK